MDHLYSLGNILMLLSLCFRKVLFIRTIFILSDLSFLLYGALADVPPVAYWAIASLIINFVQIGILLRDLMPQDLPYDLQQVKDLFFVSMQTSDFIRLIKLSERGTSRNKKILIKGEPVENLMLITKGLVYIEVDEAIIEVGPYHFIGEMSYFRDGKASTTIYAREPVDYLYWSYSDLHRLQANKPPLFMKMVEAMGKDIILKMLNQNKASKVL
ncbi:cyclic nucleotide-binding protein [Legionella qingyii]|uniref:Cyclic nucleotide-binding domain-containing protein n=1 Tax=Legionella qingyii TaxID=2184757 RepID=A0A317U6T0_9GAMM|nr:cyclic nucleotide-binding domain-containing protein [Legionella qingyii]PWY56242.1 cyclic nucleotide-binding protein [Legionella qingyii]RUR22273.1 cyclic nucleotide-binding domain-containing protein [Legionella qingyii]RUR25737.1 cyclic nucleotide-binding domain-containing protein [Legionella qingyii]